MILCLINDMIEMLDQAFVWGPKHCDDWCKWSVHNNFAPLVCQHSLGFTELSHSPHSPTDAASKPNRCCKQASLQNCMQAKEQPELRQLCSRLWHFLCCDIARASCPKNLARSSSTSEILVSLMHCFKRSFISQFYHRKPRWFYEVGRGAAGKHEHLWKLGG